MRLNVNLKEYELKKNMLFVNTPGTIVKVTELVDYDDEDMQYTLIALSKEFMLHVSDEVRKVLIGNRSVSTTPVISVTEEYYEQFRGAAKDEITVTVKAPDYHSDLISPDNTDIGVIASATYTTYGYQKAVKAAFDAYEILTGGGANDYRK